MPCTEGTWNRAWYTAHCMLVAIPVTSAVSSVICATYVVIVFVHLAAVTKCDKLSWLGRRPLFLTVLEAGMLIRMPAWFLVRAPYLPHR